MHKTLLLYAADAGAATAEIKRLGGRVTMRLSRHVLVANVGDDFDTAQLTLRALPSQMT